MTTDCHAPEDDSNKNKLIITTTKPTSTVAPSREIDGEDCGK